jgi:hypothetical protein
MMESDPREEIPFLEKVCGFIMLTLFIICCLPAVGFVFLIISYLLGFDIDMMPNF